MALTLIDRAIAVLRVEPWLTAKEAAARLGEPANTVRNALARWSTGPYARIRRINGAYRYALYQERTPPPDTESE